MNEFRNQMLIALVNHARAHIQKHKVNVEIQLTNATGVAEHSDHLETIEKELEQIAHYEDQLEVIERYFEFDGKKDLFN